MHVNASPLIFTNGSNSSTALFSTCDVNAAVPQLSLGCPYMLDINSRTTSEPLECIHQSQRDCESRSEILQEIYFQNGLDSKHDPDKISKVKHINILFHGLPKCIDLSEFSSLSELVIISQEITQIAEMQSCPNLTKLWICECHIAEIDNLSSCRCLRELFLYGNQIRRIENLECLHTLRVLWLNSNLIEKIEGLSTLKHLEVLNLSCNHIVYIGDQLRFNLKLCTLFLTGNGICNIKELLYLSKICSLRHLYINEPGSKKNPVCKNPNLPIVLLFCIPNLVNLDGVNVSSKEMHAAVRILMETKQSFYTMKVTLTEATAEYRVEQLNSLYYSVYSQILNQLHKLCLGYNSILIGSRKDLGIAAQNGDSYCCLLNEIRQRISFWEHMLSSCKSELQQSKKVIMRDIELKASLYQTELQNFGYLEFIEGNSDDDWVQDFTNFVASRLCFHYLSCYGVVGLKVLRVFRIVKRSHPYWCTKDTQSSLSGDEGDEEHILVLPKVQSNEDYAFLVRPDESEEYNAYMKITESGFGSQAGTCTLATNLNIADYSNLHGCTNHLKRFAQADASQFATFLVLRVSGVNGITKSCSPDDIDVNGKKWDSSLFCGSLQETCDCVKPFGFYHAEDFENASPEFIVQLQYVTKFQSTFPFFQFLQLGTSSVNSLTFTDEMQKDAFVLNQIPSCYNKLPGTCLYETDIIKFLNTKCTNSGDVTEFSVCNIEVPHSLSFEKFRNITHMNINHCYLQKLPGLNGMQLIHLDVSYNRLTTLTGINDLFTLKTLNINFNLLTRLHEEILVISNACEQLEDLSLQHNPWKDDRNLTELVFSTIQRLHFVDGHERAKLKADSKLSPFGENWELERLKGYVSSTYISASRIPHLTVRSMAIDALKQDSYLFFLPEQISWSSIVTLCLKSCKLQKIGDLSRLKSLRFICLDSNYLSNLDGLNVCGRLLEISAEDNMIDDLQALEGMKSVEKLRLSNNLLSSFGRAAKGLSKSLRVLLLRNNRIHKLTGFDSFEQLRELYIGNNKINELKATLLLKDLPNLVIIEFSGNPFTSELENYRLKIIHYFKCLKALDGRVIQHSEVNQAKDLIGGHLSHEFLIEKFRSESFSNMTRLDLPNFGLKVVDHLHADSFLCLQSVNLEKNNLTSFGGLLFLTQIKVLCLNQNSIVSLFPHHIYLMASNSESKPSDVLDQEYMSLYTSTQPIFPSLQVLHLAKNHIINLHQLQFHRMPSLRSLFLQHNEITSLLGFEGLSQLRELILDANKIKELKGISFLSNWSLQEIHIENNRIRELKHLNSPEGLRRIFIGGNKLFDLEDLEKFADLQKHLLEVSMLDNPVTAKQLHRLVLIHGCNRLRIIDGITVTAEERERCDAFYADLELQTLIRQPDPPTHSALNGWNTNKPALCTEAATPRTMSQKTHIIYAKHTSANQSNVKTPILTKYNTANVIRKSANEKIESNASTRNHIFIRDFNFAVQGTNCERSYLTNTSITTLDAGLLENGSEHTGVDFSVPGVSVFPADSTRVSHNAVRTESQNVLSKSGGMHCFASSNDQPDNFC